MDRHTMGSDRGGGLDGRRSWNRCDPRDLPTNYRERHTTSLTGQRGCMAEPFIDWLDRTKKRLENMMADKTMTLNLSEKEMTVLDGLAAEKEMSKTAIMRQALRLYQLVNARLNAGEQMIFSGDEQRRVEFIGL